MGEKEIYEKMKKCVVEQDVDGAVAAAKDAMSQNMDPIKCIDEGLSAGMKVISDMFDNAEVFVPQIIISADAFMDAIAVLKPHIKGGAFSKGKVIVHTVEGDIHDIGKNIFRILLTANGYDVIDMGRDVPVDDVVAKAGEESVDVVTGSALMTTTMPSQREIVKGLKEAGIRDKLKCMFGGAPVTEDWVKQIGGDAFADNAATAVTVLGKLIGK